MTKPSPVVAATLLSQAQPYPLRSYQQETIDLIHSALDRGLRRPAVVMATGGGKTVIFSHLIGQLPTGPSATATKTLVLAHRTEIVKQAYTRISEVNPHLRVGIEMAKYHANVEELDVIVALVASLSRGESRLANYKPEDFKAIILDECHHAVAATWQKVLKRLGADTNETPIPVIGFTATLERGDGKALARAFDEIVHQRDLMTMIKNDELTDIKFHTVKVDLGLLDLKTKNDDFERVTLCHLLNEVSVNSRIAHLYLALRKEFNLRSTIVFCVDIDHCRNLCAALQEVGINAQYVTGTTEKGERERILEDFIKGDIQVLANFMVFTEGTDIPNIDSIFIARPSKSRGLLTQMIGRGLRKYPGKEWCHVIDIADTIGRGFQSVPSLFSMATTYDLDGKDTRALLKAEKDLEELKSKELEKSREANFVLEQLGEQLSKLALADDFSHVKFKTIDGIAEYEKGLDNIYDDHKEVLAVIRESRIDWLRATYDTWVAECPTGFLQLSRYDLKFCIDEFKQARPGQINASGFRCKRFRMVANVYDLPDLGHILDQADLKYFKYVPPGQGKATQRQVDLVIKKTTGQINRMYGPKFLQGDNQTRYEQWLADMDKREISRMVFAAKVAPRSLYIRWQLQQVFGLSIPTQKSLKSLLIEPTPPPRPAPDVDVSLID